MVEALTLIQAGKSVRIPIVLVHSPFWAGLREWFKQTLVAKGVISVEDLKLFTLVDEPAEVLKTIFRYYERSRFELPKEEEEIRPNL
ncbi:MAG: LOG family protein [Acidiferrobacterales bacterium]|nr:LOG family protein [Acidiferrobacterales bacterium]